MKKGQYFLEKIGRIIRKNKEYERNGENEYPVTETESRPDSKI